jgi:hypothetical protein
MFFFWPFIPMLSLYCTSIMHCWYNISMLERAERTIKNGQSRHNGNYVHTSHSTKANKTRWGTSGVYIWAKLTLLLIDVIIVFNYICVHIYIYHEFTIKRRTTNYIQTMNLLGSLTGSSFNDKEKQTNSRATNDKCRYILFM